MADRAPMEIGQLQHDGFDERKKVLVIGLLAVLLVVTVSIALTMGAYHIPVSEVYRTLFTHLNPFSGNDGLNRLYSTIVWQIRFPRILLSIAVGFALAAAGAVYQGCFRNPLVEPYILGVESGAAFGAGLAIVIPAFFLSMQLSAFLFGLLAVFGAYMLARVKGETPIVTLILSGVIIGSIFAALVSILQYLATDAALREIVFWLMGGFYYATWEDVQLILPVVFACVAVIWLLSWKLNILSMGDEEARSLGINPEWYKAVFVSVATLATSLSVSHVGVIAWVGLMMPHAARMVLGPDHRFMVPAAAIMGGIYLVICDTLARTLTTAEIPVGILTSIIGAPYLMYLIRSKGKGSFR
ncbi:MAG: FecCD family ABC transporter permease [Thermoplasmatota archaeon]